MTDLVTGEAVIVNVPIARFGSRMLAIAIDLAVQIVLLLVEVGFLASVAPHLDGAAVSAIALTASVLIIVGYPTIFETLTRGRSLGKLALGLRVVADDGGPERFRQALLRALAAVVEIWLLDGAPALICSLISEQGKRLGDIFAGTIVIQERIPVRGGPMAMMPPALAGWAASLELSRLPDETVAMARQYLSRMHELAPAAREEFGWRLASTVSGYVSPPPPPGVPYAVYLSAVLAERRSRAMARLGYGQPGAVVYSAYVPSPGTGYGPPAQAAGWPPQQGAWSSQQTWSPPIPGRPLQQPGQAPQQTAWSSPPAGPSSQQTGSSDPQQTVSAPQDESSATSTNHAHNEPPSDGFALPQ